jgi:hypothetical protein
MEGISLLKIVALNLSKDPNNGQNPKLGLLLHYKPYLVGPPLNHKILGNSRIADQGLGRILPGILNDSHWGCCLGKDGESTQREFMIGQFHTRKE